jgi:hypothetical protein
LTASHNALLRTILGTGIGTNLLGEQVASSQ